MKIGQYCQWQRCRHVELKQFWQAFASHGFVSDSWAFLFVHWNYISYTIWWISHCLGYQNCHVSYTRQCRYVTLQLLWKEGNHCPWPCCQLCNKLGQLSHIINSNIYSVISWGQFRNGLSYISVALQWVLDMQSEMCLCHFCRWFNSY